MQLGMFMQPVHPPERDMFEAVEQNVRELEWLDELGYAEAWVGEHLTHPWEKLPASDLLIAQGLTRTKNIKICSGGYIPSFYHPAALALRIAQLDHMAQGRYMCGIAAGFCPTDWQLLGIDGFSGEHRDAAQEATDILIKLWTEHTEGGEWEFAGDRWTIRNPGRMGPLRPHVKPYQDPHPPIAIAAASAQSSSMAYAGARGFIPLSVYLNIDVLRQHWQTYSDAAERAGRVADRGMWRVNREVFVGATDEEARQYVLGTTQGRWWKEEGLPYFAELKLLDALKHDPSIADEDVDVDYLMQHRWFVGSVETVTERILADYKALGGYGTLLATKYDWGTVEDAYRHADAYRQHLELLAHEVLPEVNRAIGHG
jgi:alkanesulfonate monooxygenase SsuD/methylene tetrahydromethanopterin reductase-like flavin-dependent oxidoreductase (luciferase family)